ncbi:hypothetical protein [Acinetobacter phage P1068]|nr:hypothetical protein [Acinetobacter phage P1068]
MKMKKAYSSWHTKLFKLVIAFSIVNKYNQY